MIYFVFIISCLATFRLALLISKEDGPAFIFRKLRRLPSPKFSVKEGLSCEWCMSIWVSAAITAFLCKLGFVELNLTPIWWLASSSGAVIINQQWIAK